ncbi:PhzF family phenazine biosynthesis protein [Halalkalibacter urbisdiaboli]|uniref:PhzF family phenazine biosynthesis protein n=1 Tax=Halalkalibacter urbisdiaboli TaxID=1960589 RepID=UPI000B448264|nr:PhzF family phenazine biosynthesis protein [Halalkalibacter urbisdiaboli]
MKKINFVIVDVFSQGKYSGNQLAVFKVADNISDFEMQQIAKEINFSETSFINKKNEHEYDVRIFTPNEEIPFAGHPTLGTAFTIQNDLLKEKVTKLVLNLKGGKVPVFFDNEDEIIWMKQNEPIFGSYFESRNVSKILNIDKNYIDERFPIQEVSTGLPVIIVPLKSLEAVKKVNINRSKYFEFIKNCEAKAIMVFSSETYSPENDLNVRDFAYYYGIPEDAATGSSNGCLASYLVKYKYFDENKINIRVEQGYEMNRRSLLFLKARKVNGVINVSVGGRVIRLAQGEWFLD